jgi:hypothetical protein
MVIVARGERALEVKGFTQRGLGRVVPGAR